MTRSLIRSLSAGLARLSDSESERAERVLQEFRVRDAAPDRPLWELVAPDEEQEDGRPELVVNAHAGQLRALQSSARWILVLAGLQSGKTSFGPWWLANEIRRRGSGDYFAVTASYDLFKLKMLPAIRETFEHALGWGRYWSSDRVMELADPVSGKFYASRADDRMYARIILRSAESSGGLESLTALAGWADEAGQDSFDLETWHAMRGRLSLALGRLLFTTTLYNLGWLKSELYDAAQRGDTEIDVIQFDSTVNPAFPADEFESQRARLPDWKFNMRYRGQYSRPAGLIYDSFRDWTIDEDGTRGHLVKRFAIPETWQRYLGLDFGGVNTAGVFYAEDPATGALVLYRTYLEGGRTAREHASALLSGEPSYPFCVGGSRSEGQWRREFAMGGLGVAEPDISDVEIGIDRVYGAHKRGEILVFDDLQDYLQQKRSYSRPIDPATGEPMPGIANKSIYHFMDAERYIIGRIRIGA